MWDFFLMLLLVLCRNVSSLKFLCCGRTDDQPVWPYTCEPVQNLHVDQQTGALLSTLRIFEKDRWNTVFDTIQPFVLKNVKIRRGISLMSYWLHEHFDWALWKARLRAPTIENNNIIWSFELIVTMYAQSLWSKTHSVRLRKRKP